MQANQTRAKLAAGEKVAGLIVPVAAPVLVDLAGLVGFDYVLIDTEHGHLGFEAAEHLVRAAASRPSLAFPPTHHRTFCACSISVPRG